ncbi:MAG: amidinotransferase [Synergistaceae bacterium]|jgi:N-dimethylarginine dimethylaminohydrolase|nr:amidinotransferase [Synergistaceae bacterium]
MSLKESSQYYHAVLSSIVPKPLPPFQDEDEQLRVWGGRWGAVNDVGRIRVILMHRPGDELKVITQDCYDPSIEAMIDRRAQWYFRSDVVPDLAKMQEEHDNLARVLTENGIRVVYMDCSPKDPDALNVRDNGIVINGGLIVARMAIAGVEHGTGRRGEEAYITRTAAALGMPILHTIQGDGIFEGGSFCLLDAKHAAVGLSVRGNESAVEQIRSVLKLQGIELLEVPLTGYSSHIDGALVMVDYDKALVNIERLPYGFLKKLEDLGIEKISIDYRDPSTALNCLTIRPGVVVVNGKDSVWTAERLASRGIQVISVPYGECRKKGGGIHCGTLPLVRDP